MSIDSAQGLGELVYRKKQAYRNNDQELQRRYQQSQELTDLLALQQLKKEKEAKKPKPNQKKPEISQKERLTKRWHSLNTRLKKGKDTISDELRSSIRKMLQQAYKLGKEKQWDEAEKQLDRVDNNLSQQSLEEKYHRLLLPLIKAELKRTQHG